MTTLSRVTLQRLKQLPKVPSVWEADRRQIGSFVADSLDDSEGGDNQQSDCILWVDGTQATVRALAIIPSDSGPEPLVRSLLQAMENPQGNQSPARPQKIVVRNREIQFYLRGVLQDLDVAIDYAPDLPLIDELFETLQQHQEAPPPALPERFAESLWQKALEIWELAPWNLLNEQQLIAIELNCWDVETLYVSALGMAGVEYGLLMYRSLDSLKQFRQRVLYGEQSPKQMQEAFLEQDCLYLNYELIEASPPASRSPMGGRWLQSTPEAIHPEFGSLHPLEGLRTNLADEEGATLLVAMEALERFFKKNSPKLEKPPFPALECRYRIPNPEGNSNPKHLAVTVKTLPEVAQELMDQTTQVFAQQIGLDADFPVLRDDFIPEGSIILLTLIPPQWIELLKLDPIVYYQTRLEPLDTLTQANEGLPVVLVQTSRPKAQTLIQQLREANGVKAVCFNAGRDLLSGEGYELGLLQTGNGEFHLFAEYQSDELGDKRTLKRWQQWQKEYQKACGVIIAGGVTGASRGKPQLKDMFALFEATACTSEELHLPPLQLQYAIDWE